MVGPPRPPRPRRRRRSIGLGVVALLALVAACSAEGEPAAAPGTTGATTTADDAGVALRVDVVATLPHDPAAFTQGLELHDGVLVESTGLVGASSIRLTDPTTGTVLRRLDVAPPHFAEGATVVGDRIVQLTWTSGIAFTYDRTTLTPGTTFRYDGEGWGLCDDGTRLLQSDGSARLTFRSRTTFEVLGTVDVVTRDGRPVDRLNELECVPPADAAIRPPLAASGPTVWANVWRTGRVVGIDPTTGVVRAEFDVSALRPATATADDVANGLALDRTDGTLLVTGKRWPHLYRVRLVAG